MIRKVSSAIVIAFAIISISISAYGDPIITLSQTQNPKATWRLFPTSNIYTFIELNTKNGSMNRLQWGTEDDTRFETPICGGCNQALEAPHARPGRFTLYPTQNIYQFILLDQVTGSSWQVQWSDKGEVFPINFVPPEALKEPSTGK